MYPYPVLLLLFFTFNLHASQTPAFTTQEKEWIQKHPVVTLGADYLKLISQKSGLKFKVIPDVWAKSLQKSF